MIFKQASAAGTLRHSLLLSALLLCGTGLTGAQTVPANVVLRNPAPKTALTKWVSNGTSEAIALDLGGGTMRGWSFPAVRTSPGAPTLLFFYGGATILHDEPIFAAIARTGANVIVFDYRGYGFSSGTADVMDFRKDGLAEYDYAVGKAGGPVVVYGYSLGTAVATYVASKRPVAGIILAGAIASAAEEFPVFLKAQAPAAADTSRVPSPDAVEAFDEVGMMKNVTAPLLVLHGEADEVVSISQGRKVFASSAAGEKRFVTLQGIGHFDVISNDRAQTAVAEFLQNLGLD
jgi:pimeloyl-ACP methyl ester carboxylesterase